MTPGVMTPGKWLIAGGLCALFLCLAGRWLPGVRPVALRLAVFCGTVVAAGAYVFLVSGWYSHLALLQQIQVTSAEPDYFAVQTLTTVGYGGGLAFLREEASGPAAEAFRQGASWWMLLGSAVWGCAVAALANVFFSPAEA